MQNNQTHNTFLAVLIYIVLLSHTLTANAQKKQDSIFYKNLLKNTVFNGNHFGFNFGFNAVVPMTIENNSHYHFYSRFALGFNLGLNYIINFNNQYALNTGIGLLVNGRNFNYNINKSATTPPMHRNLISSNTQALVSPQAFIQLPLQIEKRWLKNKSYTYASVGTNLNYSFSGASETISDSRFGNGNYYEFFNLNTDWYNHQKLNVNLHLGYGIGFLNKRNNINKIGIVANISFARMAQSSYTFSLPNQTLATGFANLNGSYIGVMFSKLFTITNYRLRKGLSL